MNDARSGPRAPRQHAGARPRGSLGERLLTARLARGLTLAQLAHLSGVSGQTLGALERGATRATRFTTLSAVARALDVAPSWLISTDPDAPGGP